MNLVKIANMLKDSSDQALVQEMQNPSGSVPSYMVLSELDRRKKLRGSIMNSEPQSSVAEDMQAETSQANQMGIGGLQAPQQAPVGMASGGEVKHYYAGGGYDIGGANYTSEQGWNPFRNMDFTGKSGWSDDETNAYNQLIKQGYNPDVAKAYVFPDAAGSQRLVANQNAVNAKNLVPQAPPAAGPAPAAGPTPPAPPGPGRLKAPAGPAAGSMSPYLEELKGYRKDLADQYQKQADIYQQQADKLESGKSKDVAMALMQAGFGIMGGRSQFAAENIGQGAMPAIQQYAGAERARQEQEQKLAMGKGALGIESLRARMEGARGEGELGLKERAVGADEMKARAAMASAGAQSSYYKQAIAQAKSENDAAKIAASVINSQGFSMMDPADQKFFLGMAKTGLQNRLPGGAANAGPTIPTYNPKTGRIE